jgi:hypothetical protein
MSYAAASSTNASIVSADPQRSSSSPQTWGKSRKSRSSIHPRGSVRDPTAGTPRWRMTDLNLT